MNSHILKGQRDDFISRCNGSLEAHKAILLKIAEIDGFLSMSSDTLLIEYLRDVNMKIIKKMNRLDNILSTSRDNTIKNVDAKIMELEEEEKIAALNNSNKASDNSK